MALFCFLEVGYCVIYEFFCRIFSSTMTLELVHCPLWFRLNLCMQYPLAARFLLGDLEARYGGAARERATLLLRRAGFEPPTEVAAKAVGMARTVV